MSKKSQSNNEERIGNPVLSSRIDPEIHSSFEAICDKLKIKKSVVIQELVKDFIVRNIDKANHENAEIIAPKIKEAYDD
jgi:antitoxin component of RelBE/YafQ-DinJ toxin-antitoxin module